MLDNHISNYIFGVFLLILTLVKKYVNIPPTAMTIISSSLLVYIGCLFSAKLCKGKKDIKEKVETMKSKDAWLFPVFGSGVLFGLFLIFKYLNKDYINILFQVYFTLIGAYAVGALINEKICEKSAFKSLAEKKVFTVPKIIYFNPEPTEVFVLDILTYCLGLIIGGLYFYYQNWIYNNILGMAFSVFGIENLMLGEYKVGLILLVLLFFYDIFWVFFTPVMVSVAKNLNGPIKLMFPKGLDPKEIKDFNMIGLGDIVVPGVYVAFMLRFDIWIFTKKMGKPLEQFTLGIKNCKYFFTTYFSYILGLFLTIGVMLFFNHAQPALLYLVPCTLISSTLLAIICGDMKDLWKLNEEKIDEEKKENKEDEESDNESDDDKKKKKKKDTKVEENNVKNDEGLAPKEKTE